jgi:hypothetical protein
VAKVLESFQRDHNISRYFAATQLAGRAGNFLSSLRNQDRLSWGKFIAHAANASLDALSVKTHLLPWLIPSGFVDVGPGEEPSVSCNVVDHNAILRSTSSLFHTLDPTPEEIAVLGLLDLGIRVPTAKPDAFSQIPFEREEILERGLELARAYNVVKVLEDRDTRDPVIYSPLIWGDNIAKAGKALSHLNANRRALLLALMEQVRQYQGLPEQQARRWARSQGDPELVDFMVGLGLLDRTQIVTRDGGRALFLTTPHLYGELAVNHGRDACDKVRLFLDSIRHGQHFGEWHTGRISDPIRLLGKLIDQGEIGPCTAIGSDYILVEKAGVVNVQQSGIRPGQYVMRLVQEDTVRLIRDILRQEVSPGGLGAGSGPGALMQDRFVSAEQTRGTLGDLPEPTRRAEMEMLRSLRELI